MNPDTVSAVASLTDSVMRQRKSVRAFLPDAVPRALLEELLAIAATAPSNSNTQPWHVHLLAGEPKQALSRALLQAHAANNVPPFSHFPDALPPACVARQDDFGKRYYGVLGIDRADAVARARQTARNFVFFDAPVGLIFTIDGQLHKHSWLDYGLFVQNVMLAATARGLASCPQVSFARYTPVIARQLELPPGRVVVCGMSIGYADQKAAVNELSMPREPLENMATWQGF
ncbi:MAG: nitroreductase [Pseudomonadota bacterium]